MRQQSSFGNWVITVLATLLFLTQGLQAWAQSTGISGDSTINRCETKTYTISVRNDSGSDLADLVVTAQLLNLTGFSYVGGTAAIDVDGGGAFCAVDPTASGSDLVWDLDADCPGSPFTLSDGETLNISLDLATDCTAVSGSLNTLIDYTLAGTPVTDNTGVLNIQVNPGAVTIKKTPNVISAAVGDNVTWTLTVENTGFGVIENVEVTDVLGTGLAYVSSTQSGNNSGQTTLWTSTEFPALASMDPGDVLTMDITAQVVACEDLDNTADVRFGCDPSPANTCFDSATDGGTATASVQRIVDSPVLAYSPPDITFDYCEDTQNVSFTITNNGDGAAYNVWSIVDLSGFTVSNVSSGATYNAAQTRFELTDPLAAGGSYDLSFDLTYSAWCDGTFPSGDLLWQKVYRDGCGNEFYPPVELSTVNAPANTSQLTVSKSGAPAEIEIGGTITYTIASSYSGPTACGGGTTGPVTVVDTLPDGVTVTDAGGGTWVPGGGGTGGTITWTYTPPASLSTTITVQIPDATQCETYCNTTITNTISATGSDCCGCDLSASDSQTTAIECAEGVTSDKTATSPTERCDDITYTNTYVFDGGSGVVLSDLQFEEHAENQQEYNGNLSVLLGAANITGCVAVTDNTPGGSLLLDFSGCAATSLAGQTLTIAYDLTATENTVAACGGATFYSWSSLDMGVSGSECLADGVIHETTLVSVGTPDMSVTIGGLGQIVHKCESQTITLTATQDSDFNPRDVQLVLSGLNYYVVDPGATVCGGVAPVSCTPTLVGDDYIWEFGDAFTGSGQSATIQLEVQKRCSGGGNLDATVYFDDLCTDDATPDQLCSATASETPALLLSGDLLIEKTPEVYYATTNTVQWEIYVTNRGTGTAYSVWVDDVLGSGLLYEHGVNPVVVDDMTGVTVNDSLDHDGGAINGASVEIAAMAAGERRQITFIARQIDCNNLTNDVEASWGCIGVDCQTPVTDNSVVQIPAPNLINTNTLTPAGGVDACASPQGFITLRNAGQVTVYNLQVTETLPPNLLYVSGSTRWRTTIGGVTGAWNGPNVAYDPNPTISPLVWTSTEIPALASAAPGDTIEIEFAMSADCPFTGGDVEVVTQYENPCADVFTTAASTFSAAFNEPDIRIDKTRADTPIDCNDALQWTITVTNNGSYTLPIIWIEDTMDAAYTYASSVGDPPYTSDNGTNVGQVVTWELRNVNPGDTVTLTLNATSDSAPCSPDLDNTVIAYWGCGLADGSSATKPGVDAPDDTLCLGAVGTTDVRTETREPDLGYLSIAFTPSDIDACNDSTQMTVVIENPGPTDASTIDLAITLPAGLTYNAGTAESGLGTDQASATAAIGAIGDPAIAGSTLTFYDFGDKGSNLAPVIQADGGNDTLVLRFTVQSACYVTDDLDFDLRYYDCCDDMQYTETTSQQVTALYPDLAVTKTANLSQVDCGGNVQYTVTVTNNGTGSAEVVRVVDTLGDWLDYAGSFTEDQPGTITPALIGGDPQIVGWEFNDLGPGATATFTFQATLNPDGLPNQNDCTSALRQNNVEAQWACGTAGDATDDDPNTTGYDCTASGSATAGQVTLLLPNLVVTSITPSIACTADGSVSGSVSVRVTNSGDGASGSDFTVQVTDGKGWTGTGTHSGSIPAGGSVDVTIDTATWVPACNCASPYSFNATVDLNNDVCECNETDNSTSSATQYAPPIPDLIISDIDFSNVTCASDSVSGSVRVLVENTGCATASNFQVALATDGCLSFPSQSVTSLADGSSTWVTFTISGDWADCTDGSCDFTATVDQPDDVCECDGTNNSRTETYDTPLPDLVVTNIDYANLDCSGDAITGSVDVTVQNQGFGSATGFQVTLTGSTVTFTPQTVSGSLANGQSATVTLPVATAWDACDTCSADFTATVDATDAVCECDGSNNTLTSTYAHTTPNLQVTSVVPSVTCNSDGSLGGNVAVTVANNGCGDATGVVVQLASSGTYTFTNQTVTLAQGASTVLNFAFTPTSANCDVNFMATIDPSDAICECSDTDNSLTSATYTTDVPDLRVASDDLAATCEGDGQVRVAGSLTVANDGCGTALTSDIPVRLTLYDNTGCGGNVLDTWTTTLGAVNIASGGGTQSFSLTDRLVTTDLVTNSTGCQFSMRVELDYTDTICEFDGTNNTHCADNKSVDIPDIRGQADTLGATCFGDGQVTVSGSLTVANDGCGSSLTSDIPVRLTLYDNTGATGSVLDQWTETLSTVNIAAGGGTQVFTIASRTVTTDLVTNSTGCQFSIGVEYDYNDTICESDGTNNTYVADNKAVDLPDLQVSGDSLTIDCLTDGQARVSGTVTLANDGCGTNLTSDVALRITLYDGAGCSGTQLDQWTETVTGVNIAAGGGTQTFSLTSRDLTTDLCGATGDTISVRVEADYTNAICESDGTNNTRCADKSVAAADLTINSVTPGATCTTDGSVTGTVTVNVGNTGGSDVSGAVVRLVSGCGIVFTDQTVDIVAGGNADLTFNYTPSAAACTCTFTATVDPDSAICECDGTNNSLDSAAYTTDIPDLRVASDDLAATCEGDGQVRVAGSLTVANDGCGASLTSDIPVQLTLYDNTGCGGNVLDQWTMTLSAVNIASGGGTQVFSLPDRLVTTDLVANSAGCQFSIGVALDPADTICEFDGTNNTHCADNKNVDIPDIRGQADSLTADCSGDGEVTVSGSLTVANDGCGGSLTSDIPVRLTLYDNTGGTGSVLDQWTEILSAVNIAAGGGTQVFTIASRTVTTDLVTNSTGCQFSIGVEYDYNDTICESDGTNNTYVADNLPVDIINLTVATDTLSVTCLDDGQARVSGTVTLANDGCGGDFADDVPLRLTLFGDAGCSGAQVDQWTETVSGVSIPAGGGTQTFSLSDHDIVTDICAAATNNAMSVRVEADYTDAICESDGTDNTGCSDKSVAVPDLTITAVATEVSCLADGSVAGTTVSVANTGCGDASGVVVRLASDCGLTFADQTVDLAAGATAEVFFPFASTFTTCACNFSAAIDPDDAICETDSTNNTATNFTDLAVPDLEVQGQNLRLECLGDGRYQIVGSVTLANNGCGPALTDNIPMRFTLSGGANCGGTVLVRWTQTLRGVNLPSAGGTQTFRVAAHGFDGDLCGGSPGCQYSIQVEADHSNSICEWDGSDNTLCDTIAVALPNLSVTRVVPDLTCDEDQRLQGIVNVEVANDGCGDAPGVTVRLTSDCGLDLGSRTIDLPAGSAGNVVFRISDVAQTCTDCTCRFTARIDPQESVCECLADDNQMAQGSSYRCEPRDVTGTPGEWNLSIQKANSAGSIMPGSLVQFSLNITNSGPADATNVAVHDTLPAALAYVPGTSALDGVLLSDPAGGPTLTWTLPRVAAGQTVQLTYRTVARADARPGRHLNTARVDGAEPATSGVWVGDGAQAQCCLRIEKEMYLHDYPPDRLQAEPDRYFQTDMAMFAASEFVRLQQGLGPWLESQGVDHDPAELVTGLYRQVLRQGAWYAHFNLGNLSMGSGMGLSMNLAPDVVARARRTGQPAAQIVADLLDTWARENGLSETPRIAPLLLPYYAGRPVYDGSVESGDRTWVAHDRDPGLVPSAWGLTLLAQAQAYAERLRDDAFMQRVTAWQMVQAVRWARQHLTRSPDAADTALVYLPHRWGLRDPDDAAALTLDDASSHLLDQAAVLWGLSAMRTVFLEQGLTPPAELAELMQIVWQSLESLHRDPGGAYMDRHVFREKDDSQDAVRRQAVPLSLMMTALALEDVARHNPDLEIAAPAAKRLTALQAFVSAHMISEDGSAAAFDLESGQPVDGETTLNHQFALLRVLLAQPPATWLQRLTGAQRDAAVVLDLYDNTRQKLWDPRYGLFREGGQGHTQNRFTPFDVGAAMGALGELVPLAPRDRRQELLNELAAVFEKVVVRSQMQLNRWRRVDPEQPLPPVIEPAYPLQRPLPLAVHRHHTADGGPDAGGNLAPVLVRGVTLDLIPPAAENVATRMAELDQREEGLDADWMSPLRPMMSPRHPFYTGSGMLAARQLWMAADILAGLGKATDDAYRVDPVLSRHYADTLRELARASLIRLTLHSGHGLPLRLTPPFDREPDRSTATLHKQLQELADQAGLDAVPQVPNPTAIEYAQGEPRYHQGLQGGWAQSATDPVVSLAGIAQTLLQQVQFIHHARVGNTPAQPRLDRFLAGVAGLQVAAKVDFLKTVLTHWPNRVPENLRLVVDSYGHPLEITAESQAAGRQTRLSLLEALAGVALMAPDDLTRIPRGDQLAADCRDLFDAQWPGLQALLGLTETPASPPSDLSQLEVGMALDVFGRLYHQAPAEHPWRSTLREAGQRLVAWQLDRPAERTAQSLAQRSALLIGLWQWYTVAPDEALRSAARDVYEALLDNNWDSALGLFINPVQRTHLQAVGIRRYTYSDLDIGLTLSALIHTLPHLEPQALREGVEHMLAFGRELLDGSVLALDRFETNRQARKTVDIEPIRGVDLLVTDRQHLYPWEIVTFRIWVANRCLDLSTRSGPLQRLRIVDQLPADMVYLPGSAYIDAAPATPAIGPQNRLTWWVDDLAEGREAVLSFRARILEEVLPGTEYNLAWAEGWNSEIETAGADTRQWACRTGDDHLPLVVGQTGRISGRVFQDLDQDGRQGAAEPGVAGVRLRLDGRQSVATDGDGGYRFEGLRAGIYDLRLDWSSLPPAMHPVSEHATQLMLNEGGRAQFNLALLETRRVEALVFEDRNQNGRRDRGEPPVPGVRIDLRDSLRHGFSAHDGYLRVDGVPRGIPVLLEVSPDQPYLDRPRWSTDKIGLTIRPATE